MSTSPSKLALSFLVDDGTPATVTAAIEVIDLDAAPASSRQPAEVIDLEDEETAILDAIDTARTTPVTAPPATLLWVKPEPVFHEPCKPTPSCLKDCDSDSDSESEDEPEDDGPDAVLRKNIEKMVRDSRKVTRYSGRWMPDYNTYWDGDVIKTDMIRFVLDHFQEPAKYMDAVKHAIRDLRRIKFVGTLEVRCQYFGVVCVYKIPASGQAVRTFIGESNCCGSHEKLDQEYRERCPEWAIAFSNPSIPSPLLKPAGKK